MAMKVRKNTAAPVKKSNLRSDKTDTLKKKTLEALERSLGIVTAACKNADIHRATFYEWLQKDPAFKAEVEAIQDIALDFAESQLHQNIRNGDTTSIIFYLKTKGKRRGFIEKSEHDVRTGSLTVEVEYIKGDGQQ